jgi:hypothetical protein
LTEETSFGSHKAALDAVKAKEPLKVFVQAFRKTQQESPEARDARVAMELKKRAVTSSLLVAEGMTFAGVPRLFGARSLAARALAQVRAELGDIGAATTVRRDMDVTEELVTAEMKKQFVGKMFTLVTDAASFKQNGKAIAIVLTSLSLEHAALLTLHHPDDDGVYSAEMMAADIRVALEKFGIDLKTQVSFLLLFDFLFMVYYYLYIIACCSTNPFFPVRRSSALWAIMSISMLRWHVFLASRRESASHMR